MDDVTKKILKGIFDSTLQVNISPIAMLGCWSTVVLLITITGLNLLSTHFDGFNREHCVLLFLIVTVTYIFYVILPRPGSNTKQNIYIMTVSRKLLDQNVSYELFSKLESSYNKETHKVPHPGLLHRLFYNAVFSQNLFGSKFVKYYGKLYRIVSREAIFIYGDLAEKHDETKGISSVNVDIRCFKLHKFNTKFDNQFGSFRISIVSTTSIDFASLVTLVIKYVHLLNSAVKIDCKDNFTTIRRLLEEMKNWKYSHNVFNYNENIMFRICEAISEILMDTSHTHKQLCNSYEFIELCELIFTISPITLKTGLLPCYQYYFINVIMNDSNKVTQIQENAAKILAASKKVSISPGDPNYYAIKANEAFLNLLVGNTEFATQIYNDLFSNPNPGSIVLDVFEFLRDTTRNPNLSDYAKYGLALFYFNQSSPEHKAIAESLLEKVKKSRIKHLKKAAKQILNSTKGKWKK